MPYHDIQHTDWPEKKQEIIQATITAVAAHGLDKTTTARIARQAKVGEGTIYRYFKNKNELIMTAAIAASAAIFAKPRKNYNPELPVPTQFITFCQDYLHGGSKAMEHHGFMKQFIDSPAGAQYRKEIIQAVGKDPEIRPLIYPINRILHHGLQQGIIKELPLGVLIGLTLPPLTHMLKSASQGILPLNDALITMISQSCWAAVRR